MIYTRWVCTVCTASFWAPKRASQHEDFASVLQTSDMKPYGSVWWPLHSLHVQNVRKVHSYYSTIRLKWFYLVWAYYYMGIISKVLPSVAKNANSVRSGSGLKETGYSCNCWSIEAFIWFATQATPSWPGILSSIHHPNPVGHTQYPLVI